MYEQEEKYVRNPKIIKKFETTAKKMRGKEGKFAEELCGVYQEYYKPTSWVSWPSYAYFKNLYNAYADLCGESIYDVVDFESFWNKKFHATLVKLFDSKEAEHLREVCSLVFESPYSHDGYSGYRPSYRSKTISDYVELFFVNIIYFMDLTARELKIETQLVDLVIEEFGYSYKFITNSVALALRKGESAIEELVEEAILGDSGKVKLSHAVITGVIKSGVQKWLELLGKLLIAAKGQEGVRQAILELADCGSADAHAYFIKLIIDNNLTRFSSVIRAFGTWTGLSYDNTAPAIISKCVSFAYDYLTNEAQFDEGIKSADTLEIYMTLWALACRDVGAAGAKARDLLEVKEAYRRLVGWYFIHNTVHEKTRHNLAIDYIHVREPEELAWICRCLYQNSRVLYGGWGDEQKENKSYPDEMLPESADVRRYQFGKLCEVLDFIGKKKTKFDGSVFPWASVQLDTREVATCLIGLIGYDRDSDMIQNLAKYLPIINANLRHAFYVNLLDPKIPAQKELLIAGVSDKSASNKEAVVRLLENVSLEPTDIEYLANALSTTSSVLRKSIMSLMEKQRETLIISVLPKLLTSSNDKMLLAGVELLDIFNEKNSKLLAAFSEHVDALRGKENLSKDVAAILARFDPEESPEEYSPENGFGLFNPNSEDFDKIAWKAKRPNVTIYSRSELDKLLHVDEKELKKVIVPIRDILVKYTGLECETVRYDGRREKVIIGDNMQYLPLLPDALDEPKWLRLGHGIYAYYFAEEIMEALRNANVTPVTIAKILNFGNVAYGYGLQYTPSVKKIFRGLPIERMLDFGKHVESYSFLIQNILREVLHTWHEGVFDFAMSVWVSLFELIPESELMSSHREKNKNAYNYNPHYAYNSYYVESVDCMLDIEIFTAWQNTAHQSRKTDEQRIAFFKELWYEYLCIDRARKPICCVYCAKAFGLIGDDAMYYELLVGVGASDYIRSLTASANWAKKGQKETLGKYPFLPEYVERAVDRIVTVEERRGELPMPLTGVASQIGYFKGGIKHFTTLLTALGKDNFFRGYAWGGNDQAKQTSLSILLKNCYPHTDETADEFRVAVESAGINEKRLLQAVMYAPQWADLTEKAFGITGLASAVWLFHAHISERFSAEKETRVAIYSPISQQEFADGTFDKDWFLEAYNRIGHKTFNELYKNAKYITNSNITHRRSQLYTDAILGRLDKSSTEAEIEDKRNQEKLRAYALIPLNEQDSGDALSRYEFIQKFSKETKKFGAQRRASEDKAVLIALQNLAITTGFGDVDRMSWYLESEKIENLSYLMEPRDISGIDVWLAISDDGTPTVGVSKDGKTLKSLPKTLAKEQIVLDIKAAVKDLKDQKARARLSFEMAMISRTEFGAGELIRLLGHPVLRAMVSSLVFVSETSSDSDIGFILVKDDKLYMKSHDGSERQLSESSKLFIAHPYDFIKNKCWSDYQQYLYREQIVQPFKQVFREYYPITEDELAEVNVSRRYAGHQVQPQKTVALLKGRGWTVDYDSGLQRVYHRENLIVRLYALADWFSPADIEAPTLEVVQFFSRDNYEPLAFSDVPPVIFSEVMRDIDLVVSVAHVGGVDPEASHSTVEMRIALAKELLGLLSVENVSFQSAHGMIKGSMGDYSVHMGSGLVHQSGVGMIAVVPVHSQARGRIFLPFADNDPKTAEILSKILLFADDKKIKDPAILQQISATNA